MEHQDFDKHGEFALAQWSDEMLGWAQRQLTRVDARVRRTLRERPLLSLLGAATFGCLLGCVLSRR